MSWIVRPGVLRGPVDQTGKLFLVGVGDDAGRFCFLPALDDEDLDVYTISAQISYSIAIGSDVLLRQPGLVHDMPWFAGGAWMLYYHAYAGYLSYVLASWSDQPGYLPSEYQDPETEEWFGDSWWSGPVPAPGGSLADTTLVPRGLNKTARSNKTASFHWPRWIKSGSAETGAAVGDAAGFYVPAAGSGVSGKPTVGVPSWTEGERTIYRDVLPDENGNYGYGGDIRFDATNNFWLIGIYGDEAGWWQGVDVPEFGPSLVFARWTPAGQDYETNPRELVFNGFDLAAAEQAVWIAECGVVR